MGPYATIDTDAPRNMRQTTAMDAGTAVQTPTAVDIEISVVTHLRLS